MIEDSGSNGASYHKNKYHGTTEYHGTTDEITCRKQHLRKPVIS
jgi:hypothetical protein